jgi:hypothetical protein
MFQDLDARHAEEIRFKKAHPYIPWIVVGEGDVDEWKRDRAEVIDDIKAAYKKEDWREWVSSNGKKWMFDALLDLAFYQKLEGPVFWQCVTDTWRSQRSPGLNADLWAQIYRLDPAGRIAAMRPPERKVYDALAEQITLYRGAKPEACKGMSWCFDLEEAQGYAQNWNGRTYQTTVPKEAIFTYYNSVDLPDDDPVYVYAGSTFQDVIVDPEYLNEITEAHVGSDTLSS